MPKAKGRAKQFADWEEKPVQDYDPEAEPRIDNGGSDSDSDEADEDAGTEHYVAVGKSKLRRKEPASLGPQYRGTRVSRDALGQSSDDDGDEDEDEEDDSDAQSEDYESAQEVFDDPDQADLERDQLEHEGEDAEIDSDDALGESDEERFKDFTFRGSSQALPVRGKKVQRPRASDFMDEEAEESEEDEGQPLDDDEDDEEDSEEEDEDASDLEGFIDDGEEESGEEESDEDDDDDEAENNERESGSDEDEDDESEKPAAKGKRGDLASTFASGSQNVTGAIASSIRKDVAKGQAVRQQRKAFDTALNIRIRLQKALVAVNSLSLSDKEEATSEPYEAAEAAAVKLLNTIGDYRFAMQGKPGQKRKRSVDVNASNGDIWDSIQELERPATGRRKAVLENWSRKVKATQANNSGISKGSKFVKVDEPLTMLLENQLQDSERLIKRTRVPRSCAPVQASQKINEDAEIYDDADFYQLLLKELVDQRTSDTGAAGQAATIRYAAVKEAKNKKHVDTKASKGRKMRFNVHEKLQNFMAPEDRRSWEQHAIDRFFGTLFGQRLVLNEEEATDEEMDDAIDAEEAGLRLFRN